MNGPEKTYDRPPRDAISKLCYSSLRLPSRYLSPRKPVHHGGSRGTNSTEKAGGPRAH